MHFLDAIPEWCAQVQRFDVITGAIVVVVVVCHVLQDWVSLDLLNLLVA